VISYPRSALVGPSLPAFCCCVLQKALTTLCRRFPASRTAGRCDASPQTLYSARGRACLYISPRHMRRSAQTSSHLSIPPLPTLVPRCCCFTFILVLMWHASRLSVLTIMAASCHTWPPFTTSTSCCILSLSHVYTFHDAMDMPPLAFAFAHDTGLTACLQTPKLCKVLRGWGTTPCTHYFLPWVAILTFIEHGLLHLVRGHGNGSLAPTKQCLFLCLSLICDTTLPFTP